MKFKPYFNKLVIEPIKQKTIVKSENENLLEKGKVLAIGKQVTFAKVGDIVFFDSWGCSKTPPNEEGEQYYVIPENENVILGKEEHE